MTDVFSMSYSDHIEAARRLLSSTEETGFHGPLARALTHALIAIALMLQMYLDHGDDEEENRNGRETAN